MGRGVGAKLSKYGRGWDKIGAVHNKVKFGSGEKATNGGFQHEERVCQVTVFCFLSVKENMMIVLTKKCVLFVF